MNTDWTDGHGEESVKTRTIRAYRVLFKWHTDEHGLDGWARIGIRENPYHPCLSVSYSNGTRMNTGWTDGHG